MSHTSSFYPVRYFRFKHVKHLTVLLDNLTKFTTLKNHRVRDHKSVLALRSVLYHPVHTRKDWA